MSEAIGRAHEVPKAYTPVFETAEMVRLFEGLARAGWTEVEDASLKDTMASRRTWLYRSTVGLETVVQFWDMLNNIGMLVRIDGAEGDHELFRSEWISPARAVAMLDVMGIVRASDSWVTWWRAEVWR